MSSRRAGAGVRLPAGITGLALALGALVATPGAVAAAGPAGATALPAGATAPVTTPTAATGDVPEAFEFSAPALGGGRIDGADYADTGVALWFWAPW